MYRVEYNASIEISGFKVNVLEIQATRGTSTKTIRLCQISVSRFDRNIKVRVGFAREIF